MSEDKLYKIYYSKKSKLHDRCKGCIGNFHIKSRYEHTLDVKKWIRTACSNGEGCPCITTVGLIKKQLSKIEQVLYE